MRELHRERIPDSPLCIQQRMHVRKVSEAGERKDYRRGEECAQSHTRLGTESTHTSQSRGIGLSVQEGLASVIWLSIVLDLLNK